MRLLVLCKKCQRQYDASGRTIGSTLRCQCGESLTVQQPKGHDAAVVRCSSCGAPRGEGSDNCDHCGADFTLHERDLDTVCPHCLARISDRARFCHHCGRPLIPEPVLSASSALLCPACGGDHTLTSRKMADVNALECTRCTGVWLNKETFRLLTERAAELGMRLPAVAQGPPPLPVAMPAQSGRVYRPCPFCHGLMPRRSIGEQSGVVIDWCRDHGVWFDAEELPRALAWVRRGGAVELNQKRVAQAEEKARHEGRSDGGGPIGPLFDADDWDWSWVVVYALATLARLLLPR